MFNIPEKTLKFWKQKDKPKATRDDIVKLKNYITNTLPDLGADLSKPYIEFISTYGFVTFDTLALDTFWYEYSEGDQTQRFPGAIAFVQKIDRLVQVHQTMTGKKYDNSERFIPDFMLPIGVSNGEDYICLELGGQHDRIFYWEESFDPWGEGSNTRLGFVADNMYDFINNLEEWPEK